MTTITVSSTGRITIPAAMRRELGWGPGTRLWAEACGDEIVLRRMRSIKELEGIFAHHAILGRTHEREHEIFEKAVAREVMEEMEGYE